MSVEIKTANLDPVRNTFGNVARRIGGDKTASRYQEGSFDLQPVTNFHYRPLWDPERELYDKRRTAITMADWDALRDPRQFYYGSYVMHRSRLQDASEKNYELVEKHGLLKRLPKGLTRRLKAALLPLRHVEWAANNNNCYMTAYGYGSAITQGTMYNTMDRLAIAQYLSRIGLLLDDNTGESLEAAKEAWMSDPAWQPLRRLVENSMVTKDWFELFVTQNLVLDSLLHPLVYRRFADELSDEGAAVMAMLTEFMDAWFNDSSRWVDATIKVAAAESDQNKHLINAWARTAVANVLDALLPVARLMYFEDGKKALDEVYAAFQARAAKLGLTV
ncbi:MAG: aromatic/alkene monooxygenase hydroxylase subunit beta [Thauera sp.]|nr:aromatic/alkene monooxygenase hydroxylase subunit beta [Thauera sp.]